MEKSYFYIASFEIFDFTAHGNIPVHRCHLAGEINLESTLPPLNKFVEIQKECEKSFEEETKLKSDKFSWGVTFYHLEENTPK